MNLQMAELRLVLNIFLYAVLQLRESERVCNITWMNVFRFGRLRQEQVRVLVVILADLGRQYRVTLLI